MALDPKLKDAVSHLQSHAQGMQAVLDVAAAIGDIGTLEQLATEAENRKAAAYVDVDTVNGLLAQAKADLAGTQGAIDDAKSQAVQIIADARNHAAGIVSDAQDAAKNAAADVANTAAGALATVQGQVAKARDTLAAVNSDTDLAKANLDSVSAETLDLEARAQKARDYLSSLKV